MSRGIATANETAVISDALSPVFFYHASFDTGDIYYNTSDQDLVFNSNTYLKGGSVINISPIAEDSDTNAKGIVVSLNGIPSNLLSLVLSSVSQGRIGEVFLGFLNSSGALHADPELLFQGYADVPSIQEQGETSQIQITYENKLIDLQRPRSHRYTHQEQITRHSGDLGLQYVPAIQDVVVAWGRKGDNLSNALQNIAGNDTA